MTHLLSIPKLGLTMTDCLLVEWRGADGDRIEAGDILYAIETDKITSEIVADGTGFLRRFAEVDTKHEIGSIVGGLYESREAALAAQSPPATAASEDRPEVSAAEDAMQPPPPKASTSGRRLRISPLARRVAASHGIDPTSLKGSGIGGAVLRRDVDSAVERGASDAARPIPEPVAPIPQPNPDPSRRPMKGMRLAIARNMMHSLQSTAQMTAFARVDMTGVVALRKACVENEKELGARISFTDIVLKACAGVLARMPEINASIVGEEIVSWPYVNIGLAVALDDGLIVPVIRDADRKTLVEIARDRIDLATRARAGSLGRDDLENGTFTLSNFGSYGGDFETPVLNPPQSAMLGIGAINDEPVVRDGQIVIRSMMMLSMTFDHRLIDGAVAGRFRTLLKADLEDPSLMLARMR
jgi:pyruvate/2-oxoglutarate dehydrogenase complex dihydrolipoamide acyltransferase (E2) component